MSEHQTTPRPGRFYLEPVRNIGRKKNLGSVTWIDGQLVVCMGYTKDGLMAAYATPEQLLTIKRAAKQAMTSWRVRALKMLIQYYENKAK